MRLLITIVALVLGLLLAGCAMTAGSPKPVADETAASAGNSPKASPSMEDTYTPPPSPDPEGKYTSDCDYVLGDFTETMHGYRFVADAKLHNTGNVGTVDKVKAVWFLAGGGKVVRSKTVRLHVHRSKRVGFTVPASQDQIDRYQSQSGYNNCKVRVTMIDTFGEPR